MANSAHKFLNSFLRTLLEVKHSIARKEQYTLVKYDAMLYVVFPKTRKDEDRTFLLKYYAKSALAGRHIDPAMVLARIFSRVVDSDDVEQAQYAHLFLKCSRGDLIRYIEIIGKEKKMPIDLLEMFKKAQNDQVNFI